MDVEEDLWIMPLNMLKPKELQLKINTHTKLLIKLAKLKVELSKSLDMLMYQLEMYNNWQLQLSNSQYQLLLMPKPGNSIVEVFSIIAEPA